MAAALGRARARKLRVRLCIQKYPQPGCLVTGEKARVGQAGQGQCSGVAL